MFRYPISILLLMLLYSCTQAQYKKSTTSQNHFTTLADKANALLEECITYKESAGIVAGIYKDNEILWKGAAGYMDLESKRLANPEMLHRIASIAKPMTAIAILQLYEKGKLDLDVPIQKYVPYFPVKEEGEITIRHLLNHSSGINDYANYEESAPIKNYKSLKEAVDVFKDRPLLHKPGTEYRYATYGYTLLGLIIEEVSGMSFRQYMKKYIWQKAGMKSTDVEVFGKPYKNKSSLYYRDSYGGFIADRITDLSVKVPAGGFHSTVEDLLKFGKAVLEHKLIKRSTFDEMIRNPGIKRAGNPYGLGWFIYGDQDSEDGRIIGHTGSQSGASTYFQIFIDKQIVVAVLSNTFGVNNQIIDVTNKLANISLHPETIKIPLPQIIPLSDKILNNYVGEYQREDRTIRVFKENDHLFATINDRFRSQLYPTSKDKFFLRWGDMRYEFLSDKENEIDRLLLIELEETMTYVKLKRKKSLAKEIKKTIGEKGIEHALMLFDPQRAKAYQYDTGALHELGLSLIDTKQFNSAILFFKKVIETSPTSLEAFEGLAEAYLKSEDIAKARQLFVKAAPLRAGDGFYQMAINPPGKYSPTAISKDTVALFEYRGSMDIKDAFIFLQGGPDPFLSVDNNRDPFYALQNRDDILRIYPYQSQMINHSVFSPNSELNSDDAIFERKQSAEILHRIISYFKDQGKKVHVFAHSFGTQITLEYLEHHPNIADNIVLMGGKLDTNLDNYPDLEPDQLIRWKRGLEPFVSTWHNNYPARPFIIEDFYKVVDNTKQLIVEHRKKKFTSLLEHKKLDNLIFVHAKFDEASGRNTETELDFLKSKKAITIGTYGDHHSMLSNEYMTNFYNAIIAERPIKPSLAYLLSNYIDNSDLNGAIEWYHKIDKENYFINENELNTLGYDLLFDKKIEEAIEVFKINTEKFPNSWNVFDSLGEAYLTYGNKELALKNYKISVQINPGNRAGEDVIRKLIVN